MDDISRLHRALDMGDLKLIFHDGRFIKAHKSKLMLATMDGSMHNMIEDVLEGQSTGSKRKRSDSDDTDLPSITVDGAYEDWLEVLRLMYHSEPMPSSKVLNHPGLVQCLALADARQCDSLVKECISQLMKPGSSLQSVHKALLSPQLGKIIDELRPELKDKIIRGLVGLPLDFKASLPPMGTVLPFLTREINAGDQIEGVMEPYIAMSDRLVLFPNTMVSSVLWDMEDDRSVGVLEGHTSAVVHASISYNGTMAATIADSGEETYHVKIWGLGTMQCTADLRSKLNLLSFLGSDRLLLSGERDGLLNVWDIGSAPVALMDLEGDIFGDIQSISTSANPDMALSADKSVRLWDLRTGECVRVMEGHTKDICSVSMDSAGKTAVSGSADRSAKLWDLGSGRCINTYQHDDFVWDVTMHESGGSFLAFGAELLIKGWTTDLRSDQPILEADFSSHCVKGTFKSWGAASRDLSKVAICYNKLTTNGNGMGVKVWK